MRDWPSSLGRPGHAVSLGVGDPGRVTLWPATRIRCNVSDVDEDTGAHSPDYRAPSTLDRRHQAPTGTGIFPAAAQDQNRIARSRGR